jgi:hypothetical protein
MIKKEDLMRIFEDPDYIHSPKHDNSLRVFLTNHPDGAQDSVICKALCISQKELEHLYESAILKLRQGMGND